MSKRKLSLYATIIGIIIWAGPFFTGKYIEAKYELFAERMSEFEGTLIKPVSYERHWRYSIVKTRVVITDLGWQQILSQGQNPIVAKLRKLPTLNFVLEHKIYHGPLVKKPDSSFSEWRLTRAMVDSHLSLSEESKKVIEAEAGISELVQFETQMNFLDGRIQIGMEGAPFRTKDQAKEEPAAWQGMGGFWKINSDLTHLKSEVVLPGFYFDIDGNLYQGKDLSFKTERKRTQDGIWIGSGNLKAQNINYDDKGKTEHFAVEGLNLSGEMELKDGLVQTSAFARIEELQLTEEVLGPLSYNLTFKNIPQDVVFLFRELSQTMPEQGDAFAHYFLNTQLLSSLPRLLANRPEIVLNNFYVRTAEGDVRGEAGFAIGGSEASNINKVEEVIQSIAATAKVEIPKTVLRQWMDSDMIEASKKLTQEGSEAGAPRVDYQAKIARWVEKGYLIDQGDRYKLDMVFVDGKLKVNGVYKDFPDNL